MAQSHRTLTFKHKRLGIGRLGTADYAPGLLGARTFMRQDCYEPEVKKLFFVSNNSFFQKKQFY